MKRPPTPHEAWSDAVCVVAILAFLAFCLWVWKVHQ